MHVTLQDVAKTGRCVNQDSLSRRQQPERDQPSHAPACPGSHRTAWLPPNILARSLVNKRSDTLAVVAWGLDSMVAPHAC